MAKVRVMLEADGTVRSRPSGKALPEPRFDAARVDATSEPDIARQARADEDEAMAAAAAFARRVRRRTGLTQASFASRIGVPVDTVRNWEQGKRLPAGPAKALLRIIDRAPEAALSALG